MISAVTTFITRHGIEIFLEIFSEESLFGEDFEFNDR
jgi:hypothetical protein